MDTEEVKKRFDSLPKAEQEIVWLRLENYTLEAIALKMHIGSSTAYKYNAHILAVYEVEKWGGISEDLKKALKENKKGYVIDSRDVVLAFFAGIFLTLITAFFGDRAEKKAKEKKDK